MIWLFIISVVTGLNLTFTVYGSIFIFKLYKRNKREQEIRMQRIATLFKHHDKRLTLIENERKAKGAV